jgi:hypothetical protein
MEKGYRIVFESYEKKKPTKTVSRTMLLDDDIEKPTSLLDLSMGLDKQITLIQGAGDCLLSEKLELLSGARGCSTCKGKLTKLGKHVSTFHDVFTDHKVKMQRLKCADCGSEEPSTVRTVFHGVESGELMKIQAELGSKHTFRQSEHILSLFSNKRRQINNHDRVKQVVEGVGEEMERLGEEEIKIVKAEPALELILNVDGGHLKTTEDKGTVI